MNARNKQKPLKKFLEKNKHLIAKDKLVLELGCGFGEDAIELVKLGYCVEVVDHSMRCINHVRRLRAEQELDHLITACARIQEFRFTKKYGSIIALHVLHFLRRQERNLIIGKMKSSTQSKGAHFIASFTPHGDLINYTNIDFCTLEEMWSYYADWNILLATKKMMPIKQRGSQGEARKHEALFFIAQKP